MSDQLPDDAITAAIRRHFPESAISGIGTSTWDRLADEIAADVKAIAAQAAAAERERIRTELRNRAASERDEAIASQSPSAAERHIHAGAALDAAADLLDGAQ